MTVVPDDDLVEEPFKEPCDEPSGTRTPPTPEVSPSHADAAAAAAAAASAETRARRDGVPGVYEDLRLLVPAVLRRLVRECTSFTSHFN